MGKLEVIKFMPLRIVPQRHCCYRQTCLKGIKDFQTDYLKSSYTEVYTYQYAVAAGHISEVKEIAVVDAEPGSLNL